MSDIVTVIQEQYFTVQQEFSTQVSRALKSGYYTKFEDSDEELEPAEGRAEFNGGVIVTTVTEHRLSTKQRLWTAWHRTASAIRGWVTSLRRL